MSGSRPPCLLADIGGTRARFALYAECRVQAIRHLAVADYDNPIPALRAYLDDVGVEPPARAVLAVAGPVDGAGTRARLTNASWDFDAEALARALDIPGVLLVNDFAAQAWALPALEGDDLARLGGGGAIPDAPMLAVGPGTGLGVAAYLPRGAHGDERVVSGEGGHITLAAGNGEEAVLIERLRARFVHVSAERVLSGPGLVALAEAVAALSAEAGTSTPDTPAGVIAAARAGDAAARRTLGHFASFLGAFAGDLALIFGARGGVYLTGGLPPALRSELAESVFRERFEDKGRFHDYLRETPTWIVTRRDPAFLGLARLAGRLTA